MEEAASSAGCLRLFWHSPLVQGMQRLCGRAGSGRGPDAPRGQVGGIFRPHPGRRWPFRRPRLDHGREVSGEVPGRRRASSNVIQGQSPTAARPRMVRCWLGNHRSGARGLLAVNCRQPELGRPDRCPGSGFCRWPGPANCFLAAIRRGGPDSPTGCCGPSSEARSWTSRPSSPSGPDADSVRLSRTNGDLTRKRVRRYHELPVGRRMMAAGLRSTDHWTLRDGSSLRPAAAW